MMPAAKCDLCSASIQYVSMSLRGDRWWLIGYQHQRVGTITRGDSPSVSCEECSLASEKKEPK